MAQNNHAQIELRHHPAVLMLTTPKHAATAGIGTIDDANMGIRAGAVPSKGDGGRGHAGFPGDTTPYAVDTGAGNARGKAGAHGDTWTWD